MMSFKLISKEGSLCSIMYRMAKEPNNKCCTFIGDSECKHIADNLIDKVKTPIELDIQMDDVVLFDASGAGEEADVLKDKGYTVIGAGCINDKLELDRSFGLEFMKQHKIRVPNSYTFQDFSEVEAFIQKRPERYVFKPSGNPGLSLTYVATSPENMVGMLPYLKREVEKHGKAEFVLQEIVDGVEMSTEAWFNGKNFIMPLNSTFEEKKFMEGGRGPNTGCMGSVTWNWSPEYSLKLYELLFRDLENELEECHYLGPLDINCIWTPSGPYALEFTPRFGFDAIQGFLRTLSIKPDQFFTELQGLSDVPANDGQIALAVAISTPPYPSELPIDDMPQVPVLGITEKDLADTVYHYDMKLDDEIGQFMTTGAYNWVLSVTDNDESFERLRRRVYEKVDSIEVADKQFRSDIGERFAGDLKRVSHWIGRI